MSKVVKLSAKFLALYFKLQYKKAQYFVVLTSFTVGDFIFKIALFLIQQFINVLLFIKKTFSLIFLTIYSCFVKFMLGLIAIIINFFVNFPNNIFLFSKFVRSQTESFYKFLKSGNAKYFFIGVLTATMVSSLISLYQFALKLPSPENIGHVNFAQSSHIYDRNGKLLYEIYKDVNRTSVNLHKLPNYVSLASIAIEDKNFYSHFGVSLFGGVFRAIKDTYLYKDLQGGSTITQQLVKTSLLTPERTIERKIKEIIISVWAEIIYTKAEILEMYLNQVPYGGSAYGIEEASKIYFGKTADRLSISEAALLAGLPRAPSLYSPFINPDLAIKRRDQVLKAMYEEKYISKKEFDKARLESMNFKPPIVSINAPHFVMYAREKLENEYGPKKIQEGGLRVTSTIDLNIQKYAEKVLQEEINRLTRYNAKNGAVIVLDAQTGEILSMVGSVDYYAPSWGAFNVTTALRQPGSSLKPLLYSMALERGYTASTIIDDSPVVFQINGSLPYRPQNYDRRFHGRVPLRYALANSYNIPAVKVLNTLGVDSYVLYAQEMGIDSWSNPSRFGLSLSLGGGEVSLLDLTQIYAIFASGGYKSEPSSFLSIKNSTGDILRDKRVDRVKVLDEGVSYIISDILADNIARSQAFGLNSPLNIKNKKISVKTGTTNDYKDAWTIGYSQKYVVGVWVGNNNNAPMHQIAGSLGAGPIFNKIMTFLLENYNHTEFPETLPSNVVGTPCYNGRVEYFIRGTEEKSFCLSTYIKKQTPTPSL